MAKPGSPKNTHRSGGRGRNWTLGDKLPLPDGYCWCDCGQEVTDGKRFISGHDKRAEALVIKQHYGNVGQFLVAHGYGPGGKDLQPNVR